MNKSNFECLEMLKLNSHLQNKPPILHITVHLSFDDFGSCFDDEDEDELFGLDGCTCYM